MAKRRGNNEGSISKRKDGRWMGRYTVHTAEGPKQRAVYGKMRSEVAEKLTKAMADRDGGLTFDAGNVTVGEYLDRWLTDAVRDTVRQRTYERYEQIARVHIKPRVKLKSFTTTHVRGLIPREVGRRALTPHGPVRPRDAPEGSLSGRGGRADTAQCGGFRGGS